MKDSWILNEIAAQRGELFLWAPVFFGAGIGLYFALPHEPPWWAGLPFVLLAGGLIFLLRQRKGMAAIALVLLLAAGGFTAAQVRTHLVATPLIEKETGPARVTGTIETVEILEEGKGERLLLTNLAIEKIPPGETPRKIRLTMRGQADFRQGSRVELLADVTPLSEPVAPGAFDFQRHLFFSSIGGTGFIYKTISSETGVARPDYIEALRNIIAARMAKALSPGAAPMAIAFTTGQRTAISEEDNTAMRNAGVYHLVSISGLHIGIFSAFVFFTARFLMACVPGMALKHPIKKYAAVAGFLAAAFYTVLAGASIPTQRSLLMVAVIYLAIILDRSPISLRLVAFAALVILLVAPESLISASFQMSFAAVAALVVFYGWSGTWVRGKGPLSRAGFYFIGVCLTTIVATLATAPFLLFHFQNLALYTLAGNALAVPLTTFIIMPAIVLSLAAMPLHLEYLPLQVLDKGIAALLDIAHWVSGLPHAVMYVTAWPTAALAVMTGGMIFLALWQGRLRLTGLIPIAAGVLMVAAYQPPDIIVAPEFDLMAYYSPERDLYVSGRRKNKFGIENLERLSGLEKGAAKVWPREGRAGEMACDESACRLELKNQRVSFLKKPGALREECGWAGLVIAFGVLERKDCNALDKFDGLKHGAHAVWLEPSGIRIQNAAEVRGQRPWTN